VTFADIENGRIIFPDSDSIVDSIKADGSVMLLIDPFNHAHDTSDGNNNAMIAKVAGEMFRIAKETGAALLLLHHLRKGSKGDADDLMGAVSLRATFRSCRIMARMAPEVAEKMKLPDPWRYIRITGSKENYAPPPDTSKWFKLESVALGNVDEVYTDGDEIGVATTWNPPAIFEGMSPQELAAVFAALRETPHSPSKLSKKLPWVAKPLMEIGGRTEAAAKKIVAAWIESSVLIKDEDQGYDANRNKIDGLILNTVKADAIMADINVVHEPPE
jgi:hypothetical protein